MLVPNRHGASPVYRYGFGGHEKDDELKGEGNSLDFGGFGYDPRTGRRWNVDPMAHDYPWQSPYVAFDNNPIFISDPTGLEGDPPAGHKQHKSADNNTINLPSEAKVETYKKTENTTLASHKNVSIPTTKGSVKAFVVNGERYVAAYDSKSGQFRGYKNFKKNSFYKSPDDMKTTGTIAKIGFGETRGLYPTKNGGAANGDPANWDQKSAQELMKARAAIEIVAKRNSATHSGAVPSDNVKNAEFKQRPFAIVENFPAADSEIANDASVTNFYNANEKDYIPGNTYVNKKYWNISIVKQYGPFYNASAMGDTEKGKPIYVIFYKVTKK